MITESCQPKHAVKVPFSGVSDDVSWVAGLLGALQQGPPQVRLTQEAEHTQLPMNLTWARKKKKKKKNTCKLSHTTTQYSDSCVSEDLICIIGPTDCMSASKLYYTHTVSHTLNAVPPLSLIRSAMCVLSKDQANMCATKVMKEGQNSKGRRLSLPHFEVILALQKMYFCCVVLTQP